MPHLELCPFCRIEGVILENAFAYVRWDVNPVNRGHALVIPRRHVASWFDTTAAERESILDLANDACREVQRQYSPDGWNLGINVGEAAGQTIFHVHLHLIPRYRGDVDDPRGGVRGVIPLRQQY
jgi:diadenosine tetraphosphate (Ap4A) HIT family hydrolase